MTDDIHQRPETIRIRSEIETLARNNPAFSDVHPTAFDDIAARLATAGATLSDDRLHLPGFSDVEDALWDMRSRESCGHYFGHVASEQGGTAPQEPGDGLTKEQFDALLPQQRLAIINERTMRAAAKAVVVSSGTLPLGFDALSPQQRLAIINEQIMSQQSTKGR